MSTFGRRPAPTLPRAGVQQDRPAPRRTRSGTRPAQRGCPRADVRIMSEIVLASEASDQDAWLGVATNISLGGAYIETSAPASFGDRVRLRMPLPGLSEPAQIECVVRWCSADGVGLQFGAMGAKETHGLTALIAKSQTSAPSEPGEPAP